MLLKLLFTFTGFSKIFPKFYLLFLSIVINQDIYPKAKIACLIRVAECDFFLIPAQEFKVELKEKFLSKNLHRVGKGRGTTWGQSRDSFPGQKRSHP